MNACIHVGRFFCVWIDIYSCFLYKKQGSPIEAARPALQGSPAVHKQIAFQISYNTHVQIYKIYNN